MIEAAKSGVSYAVEVIDAADPRPEPEWRTRFGWFDEVQRRGMESGLERAKRNLEHAQESAEYADARIVRRTTTIEHVSLEAL